MLQKMKWFTFLLLLTSSHSFASMRTLKVYLHDSEISPISPDAAGLVKGSVYPAIFGLLLKVNKHGDIVPGLIKKWTYDFKSNSYTFVMSDAHFHNGRSIESKDLEFSLLRSFYYHVKYYQLFTKDILGVDQINPKIPYQSGSYPGIQIVDRKTIKVFLRNKNTDFLKNMTNPFLTLVPKEALKDSSFYQWKGTPIGAGPYRISKDYQNHEMILENSGNQSVSFDRIHLHTKRISDRYDLLFENIAITDAENHHVINVAKKPACLTSFFFSNKSKLSNDPNFRKALYHGINRQAAMLGSPQLKPANQFLVDMEGVINSKTTNPYNLNLAKQCLTRVPKNLLKTVRIAVLSQSKSGFPPVVAIQVPELKRQLEQLGLSVVFEPRTENIVTDEMLESYDMRFSSRILNWIDPLSSFATLTKYSPFGVEVPQNNGRIDRLYDEVDGQKTDELKFKKMKELARLIDDEHYILPVFQRYSLYRTNPETIKSLGDQGKEHFLDFSVIESK